MSQEQPVRDQQAQPEPTSTPRDDKVQYPDVPSGKQKVESEPAREQLYETADGQERSSGTDVMGDPVKPDEQQTRDFDSIKSDGQRDEPAVSKRNPYVQQPQPTGDPPQQAQGGNPYVQSSSADNVGKGPMGSLQDVFSKWTKKAEGYTGNAGNYWTHLSTGSNITETALGRLSAGTKILTEGGLANVFKKTFPPVSDKEELRKTYACYLSTSTGPVAGTIFLSTERLAFVSDSPLSPTPNTGGGRPKGEQSGHYYKVVIPLDKIATVNPTENPKKASEKYIQVATNDKHEFWFMGFISYDKAVTNLQQAVKEENLDNNSDLSTSPQASEIPPKPDDKPPSPAHAATTTSTEFPPKPDDNQSPQSHAATTS